MRSLRTRLLISHSLPLLIIILLAGFALDYVVETRILLPSFADELSNEAKLLAELTALQPDIWDEPQAAQAYLARLEPILAPYVSIFDLQGKLLGSTDPFLDIANPPEIKSRRCAFRRYPHSDSIQPPAGGQCGGCLCACPWRYRNHHGHDPDDLSPGKCVRAVFGTPACDHWGS